LVSRDVASATVAGLASGLSVVGRIIYAIKPLYSLQR